MANITDLANGLGLIYIVAADGTTVLSNIPNDETGKLVAIEAGLTGAPLFGNIAATGTIEFSGADANVTGLTVNGVSIISGAVTAQGTIAATVRALRDNINAYTSTPNYNATSDGTTLSIIALPTTGSTPNGYAVAILTTMTTSISDMDGGTDTTGVYDDITGRRIFLNADYDAEGCSGEGTALPGDLTDSIEITRFLTKRGLETSLPATTATISDDSITIERTSSITIVTADTQGAAATDDLKYIKTTDFNIGDILIIRGTDVARVISVKNVSSGNDNILTANETDWTSGTAANAIGLELVNYSGALRWAEIFRTPNLAISVANLRTSGLSIPVQGVTTTALTGAAQTITLTPGTSKEYQRITGNAALTGAVSVAFAGTPKDGDYFFIDYRATMTLGAFTIVIAGISLTATQALEGGYLVFVYYDLTNTAWRAQIFKGVTGEDLVDTTQLATKEDDLGNPSTDGQVLQSTTSGTRSWTTVGRAEVLENETANNQTTAVVAEEILKTYTVEGNTFSADGGIVTISAVIQTAANANGKTIRLKWGATTIATATGNFNNETILIKAEVNRIDATNQSATSWILSGAGLFDVQYSTPAENLAADFDIELTGQNAVASASDIVSRQWSITLM